MSSSQPATAAQTPAAAAAKDKENDLARAKRKRLARTRREEGVARLTKLQQQEAAAKKRKRDDKKPKAKAKSKAKATADASYESRRIAPALHLHCTRAAPAAQAAQPARPTAAAAPVVSAVGAPVEERPTVVGAARATSARGPCRLPMLLLRCNRGMSNLDSMRLLLNHPAADSAEMMMHTNTDGALIGYQGHVDAMSLLLDHTCADPAAMMAFDGTTADSSALIAAARFAAESPPYDGHEPTPPCVPLPLLLRRIAVEPQPSDAQQARMTTVWVTLRHEAEYEEDEEALVQEVMFEDWLFYAYAQPDDARDECVRLLLAHGAYGITNNNPVVWRIMREMAQLARMPQLINEAVAGTVVVP
ncbi:hypothetical protein FOA52_013135 [Chlamydomonas sp. UWO 241]|nr:hypothetical protein FOA52_013135 [Chlamydomonas sp. UWO 241]